jgi:hypothetical protein
VWNGQGTEIIDVEGSSSSWPAQKVPKWQATTMRSFPWQFAGFKAVWWGSNGVGDDPAELLSFLPVSEIHTSTHHNV